MQAEPRGPRAAAQPRAAPQPAAPRAPAAAAAPPLPDRASRALRGVLRDASGALRRAAPRGRALLPAVRAALLLHAWLVWLVWLVAQLLARAAGVPSAKRAALPPRRRAAQQRRAAPAACAVLACVLAGSRVALAQQPPPPAAVAATSFAYKGKSYSYLKIDNK